MLLREYKAGVLALTFICGLIDAACFLALGGVFAELMTGNLLLMAFTIGTFNFALDQVVSFGSAILAFCLGAFVAGLAMNGKYHHRDGDERPFGSRFVGYPLEFCVVLLATVLAIVLNPRAVSPALLDSGVNLPVIWDHIIIVALLAFAMGMHNALMRRRGVPDVATNVMTLTLTGLIAQSAIAGGESPHWQRRLGSIALFVAGAAFGAWLLNFSVAAPLIAATIVFAIALYPLVKGREEAALIAEVKTTDKSK